jgi:prepilin-type N-terminal cleavage/methylation domain-containing protein
MKRHYIDSWCPIANRTREETDSFFRPFKKEPMNAKYRTKGFTLVELMIVVIILCVLAGGLIAGVGIGCAGLASDTVRERATGYARHYTRRFKGWSNPLIECAGVDNDHNGYVTCTVAEGVGKPSEQIECPSNPIAENNRSCRVPQLRSVQWPGNGGQ